MPEPVCSRWQSDVDRELCLDSFEQPLFDLRYADLPDDVGKETMNDQTTSLGLVDAPAAEIEQLLVVESTGCRRMAGAFDLPGLDLKVGDRVGAATVGEHQVLVRLVGVDAFRDLADQQIADPDGVCSLSL